MGRRPLLVMVLGWFAVVGAVGAITFVVVSNAGSGVGRASAAERLVVVSPTASELDDRDAHGYPDTVGQLPRRPRQPRRPPALPLTCPRRRPALGRALSPGRRRRLPVRARPPSTRARRRSAPRAGSSWPPAGARGSRWCRSAHATAGGVDRSISPRSIEVTSRPPSVRSRSTCRCVDEVPTRLKPGAHWGGTRHHVLRRPDPDDVHPEESRSPQLVHPPERVQSEGLGHATPTASSTPSSTEETPHG